MARKLLVQMMSECSTETGIPIAISIESAYK